MMKECFCKYFVLIIFWIISAMTAYFYGRIAKTKEDENKHWED